MPPTIKFNQQIPSAILNVVEKTVGSNMILYKPEVYVADRLMFSEDYHIILPSSPPPDSFINGELRSFTNKKIIAFNPGDTILSTGCGVRKQYVDILIKPQFVNEIATQMGFTGSVQLTPLHSDPSGELLQAIHAFDREGARTDRLSLVLDCLATQITAMLLRECAIGQAIATKDISDTAICLNRAKEYIHAFYSSDITIDDICREVNLSRYHFIRSFKRGTGLSPHQYLMRVRIQKAKDLLSLGPYTVTEAAALCGFISISHFSRTFKNAVGKSPQDFKRRSSL